MNTSRVQISAESTCGAKGFWSKIIRTPCRRALTIQNSNIIRNTSRLSDFSGSWLLDPALLGAARPRHSTPPPHDCSAHISWSSKYNLRLKTFSPVFIFPIWAPDPFRENMRSATTCLRLSTEQAGWGLTYLKKISMSFLIIIGNHIWGWLFPPSVRSGSSIVWNLLDYWGYWGSTVSWGSWGSRASQRSQRSQRSRASRRSWAYRWSRGSRGSPEVFASREFCASWMYQGSYQSRGSWGCGGSWEFWASILGVWLLFLIFDPKNTQKHKNRTLKRRTFFLWLDVRIAI